MVLKINNVLSGKKEEFKPVVEDKVNIYVCGVTVYGRCHVGHLRCYLSFDSIIRYLDYKGFDVNYVRNYTDIDDKIIARANEIEAGGDGEWTKGDAYKDYGDNQWKERLGEDTLILERSKGQGRHLAEVVSDHFIDIFKNEDFGPFDLFPAKAEPRVSENIPEVIELIEKIIANGFAYESQGDVYFDVSGYHEKTGAYGKLSRRDFTQLLEGARVNPGDKKRNGVDFALWKSASPSEPTWDSPWGKGRPGWHIECSAMSQKELGTPFDIHGGGKDLIFPHHENEIAQAEAGWNTKFCNTWMHNGFVTVNGVKMSKSLGNFITISEALTMAPTEVWRLLVLGSHYTSPIDFSRTGELETDDSKRRGTIDISFNRLEYFYETLIRADEAIASGDVDPSAKIIDDKRATKIRDSFENAMDDDFNTARAMADIGESLKYINELCDYKAKRVKKLDGGRDSWRATIDKIATDVRDVCKVLNILQKDPVVALDEMRESSIVAMKIDKEQVLAKLDERVKVREQKDFARSDEIRDELISMGVELRDSPTNTTWKVIRK